MIKGVGKCIEEERLTEFLQAVRRHINDRIDTIYEFIKSFVDNRIFIFEEYMGPLKRKDILSWEATPSK